MCTIRLLPDALVNQIAAGEVVERPASVVKELVENALDAGASSIRVEVDEGGLTRILVCDDGRGMSAEDAPLCVQRHATSKIATPDDLVAIRTFGFRGEALPSIASVSRFRLVTRRHEDVAGTVLRIEGGEAPLVEPIGCAVGTTVEVSELFFNVPARRKFLRAVATENAQIAEVCFRAALAQPALRLTLMRNGKRAKEYLPARDRATRARGCFDEALRELTFEEQSLRGHAFLGAPERARTGAAGLHVLVNGRAVRDRRIATAVAQAYGSVLPTGRYPSGVLYLEIDPAEVDVNVHPQKSEVRLAGGSKTLERITRALARSLGTTAWRGPAAAQTQIAARAPSYWEARLGNVLAEQRAEYGAAHPLTPSRQAGRGDEDLPLPQGGGRGVDGPTETRPVDATLPSFGHATFGALRAVAQVRKMLILCEGEDGLHVIDQHAADERVRFDRLRKSHRARSVATQRLLFPERVEVSASEAALVLLAAWPCRSWRAEDCRP